MIAKIIGLGVYSKLKFESGGHRVQRVPATETQGRIHTSACTVAVMPEADAIEDVVLNPAELRIDTFRASGAGGQHINKTDSAVRITHLPTGIVVECQDDRSQHKNKAQALSVLAARIKDKQVREQQAKQAATRKSLVGSGDRSERIRTYNFPQGRVTDHRINLTLYKIDQIMDGALDDLIDALHGRASDRAARGDGRRDFRSAGVNPSLGQFARRGGPRSFRLPSRQGWKRRFCSAMLWASPVHGSRHMRDESADPAAADLFRELVRRRRGGEPVAYLVGRREFYGLDFRLRRTY